MSIKKIAIFALILWQGCSGHFVKVNDEKQFVNYLTKIEAHNAKVNQLKATLDIKGRGFVGSFFHEQADVVVQKPEYFYWSLRSFFGTPAMVVASNGHWLTMYDFLSKSGYQRFDLKDEKFFSLFDFRFHPQSLIYMLMGQIPLGSNIELKSLNNKLEISSLIDGWKSTSILDLAKNRLLKTTLVNDLEGISYKATYGDFSPGIDFHQSLVLQVKGQKSVDLEIKFSSIELNGPLVSSKVFYLKP